MENLPGLSRMQNQKGEFPHSSTEQRNVVVSKLIQIDDIAYYDEGLGPVCLASKQGDLPKLMKIFDGDTDINEFDNHHCNGLHHAVF